MEILRRKKQDNYTVISNEIVKNKDISLKTKGLYLTIMSLPDGWDFSIKGMKAILKENETAIYTAIKELIKYGYCVRNYLYTDGKRSGVEYIFYESQNDGLLNGKNLNLENLNLEKLNFENQAQLSTYSNKELKDTNKELNIYIGGDENLDSLETEKEEKEKKVAPKKEKEPLVEFELEYNNIKISEKEYGKLVMDYGEERTIKAVQYLSSYKIERKYSTESDYLTIRRWVFKAIEDRNEALPQAKKYESKIEQAMDANAQAKEYFKNLSQKV